MESYEHLIENMENITHLKFHKYFNDSISRIDMKNIIYLKLGNMFNEKISHIQFPELKHLEIHSNIFHETVNMSNMNKLEILIINGNGFSININFIKKEYDINVRCFYRDIFKLIFSVEFIKEIKIHNLMGLPNSYIAPYVEHIHIYNHIFFPSSNRRYTISTTRFNDILSLKNIANVFPNLKILYLYDIYKRNFDKEFQYIKQIRTLKEIHVKLVENINKKAFPYNTYKNLEIKNLSKIKNNHEIIDNINIHYL